MPDRFDNEALRFHNCGKPGKLEICATKPLVNAKDLSLAYSPGVAAPVIEISKNPDAAFEYTNKGNMVAVVSNGTAILGLGNKGALASKPVMEGKSVLFKRFAGIDSIDLEIDTDDPSKFINCVRYLGAGFSGINLEDIKAPESLYIEAALDSLMDIPVFHDDQHGTAIVVAAALTNALILAKKPIHQAKIVVAGAGSAALAVVNLIKVMGVQDQNLIMFDEGGVLHRDRLSELNKWQKPHAIKTKIRKLEDAFSGADVAIGLSTGGVFTQKMISRMCARPIIFALANPTPEIFPEEILEVAPDAIIATGRSDYPNQVNNLLCFPFIFRGAIDVRARTINEEMKLACIKAIAKLGRADNTESAEKAVDPEAKDILLPSPFDRRLLPAVASAVAMAAIESGVSRKSIDLQSYIEKLNTDSKHFSQMNQ